MAKQSDRPQSIKTINQKIRRLGRKYGTESVEYQKYLADIDRNFGYHYTKDGILQINSTPNLSKYQSQILHKLGGRKGIRQLEADAKKRLKAEGIEKPSRADIEKEVKQFSSRQTKIDDMLEAIYIEEGEGSLPLDIANVYSKFHRHGRGAGSGVSNEDIDYLIESMEKWEQLKEHIQELSQELIDLGISDDYIDSEVWRAMSGRYSLADIEGMVVPELEQRLEDYYS